jgi:hypothetical protein
MSAQKLRFLIEAIWPLVVLLLVLAGCHPPGHH